MQGHSSLSPRTEGEAHQINACLQFRRWSRRGWVMLKGRAVTSYCRSFITPSLHSLGPSTASACVPAHSGTLPAQVRLGVGQSEREARRGEEQAEEGTKGHIFKGEDTPRSHLAEGLCCANLFKANIRAREPFQSVR